jgi:hypothetical protein
VDVLKIEESELEVCVLTPQPCEVLVWRVLVMVYDIWSQRLLEFFRHMYWNIFGQYQSGESPKVDDSTSYSEYLFGKL